MGNLQTFHIEPPCRLGHHKDTLYGSFRSRDHCISFSRRTHLPRDPDTDNFGDRGCGVDGAEGVVNENEDWYAGLYC